MMPHRDPTETARIAPDAEALINCLDAMYCLLEEVEEMTANWENESWARNLIKSIKQARQYWDRLTVRDSRAEQNAMKLLEDYKNESLEKTP
jgi:uncharacterized membrane protein YccC